MPKLRVYQLAKELKVQSALILELLDRLGKEVKSDLSSLDAETADAVRREARTLRMFQHESLPELFDFLLCRAPDFVLPDGILE